MSETYNHGTDYSSLLHTYRCILIAVDSGCVYAALTIFNMLGHIPLVTACTIGWFQYLILSAASLKAISNLDMAPNLVTFYRHYAYMFKSNR